MTNSQRSTSEIVTFPHGGSDALDNAGRAAFDAIRRAAATAEQQTQVALGLAHKTTLQLRAAEERIAQLEAEVQHARARSQRAEQWLHKIVAEIEQRFDGKSEHRNERPQQTATEVHMPTGAEVYAPKKRQQQEEMLTGLAELVHARSRSG
jgi:chromosome segregation ATPase